VNERGSHNESVESDAPLVVGTSRTIHRSGHSGPKLAHVELILRQDWAYENLREGENWNWRAKSEYRAKVVGDSLGN
jgi:hypothetical protein